MGQQNNSNSGASSTTQISDDSGIVSAVELLKDRYPGQLNQIKNEASKASFRKFFTVASVVTAIVASG